MLHLLQMVEHIEDSLFAIDAPLYCIVIILGHYARNPATDEVLTALPAQSTDHSQQAGTADPEALIAAEYRHTYRAEWQSYVHLIVPNATRLQSTTSSTASALQSICQVCYEQGRHHAAMLQ